MVCHRWTLALILLTVPLLVTVISAFRVRLPGSSHEVKADFRRHKCEDCDVSDNDLDPVLYSLKKESVKRFDDIKKVLKDKRHLIEEKLGKTSFETTSDSEEDNDDEHDESVLEKSTLENVKLETDSEKKVKGKKPSLVIDFDDDDDSDIEDDDEYDEPIPKSAKKEPETKKKTESLTSYKDIKHLPKIKTKVTDKDERKVDDFSDAEGKKQRLKEEIPVRDLKAKILPPKDIVKEHLKSKEKPLKVKDSTGDDEEVKPSKVLLDTEKLKSKTEYKIKENLVKESISLKPILDKKALKDDIQVKGKKLENKEIKIEKKPEKSVKITIPKENIQVSPPLEEAKTDLDESQYKENVTKRLSKDNRVQHLSDALLRRNLLQSEFEDFYAFLPTFAPNFSRIHNPECRRHGQILLRQLRGSKLWALNSEYINIHTYNNY